MTTAITKPVNWKNRTTKEAKEAAAWIEGSNPLRGMTISRAQALFDASRQGDTVHLQWLYNEIEGADPTLLICAERRAGAMVTPDWSIRKRKSSRVRGYDDDLADEQVAMLEAEYGRAEMFNMNKAQEHLALGFFRGFSHIAPMYTYDGKGLAGFDILNGWNFKRNLVTGQWYWDPAGHAYSGFGDAEPIPFDELCSVVRTRHIDYPALSIFLRNGVGEKLWGQFMERYGIPPVTIIMPPNVPPEKESLYLAAASEVARGGSGALPNGSEVSYATEARATDPFTTYLDHQQRLVVLMATGGAATSLDAVSGLNGNVGDTHESTWNQVWRKDAVILADAFNLTPTRILLNRNFPGQPHLAYFAFDTEPTQAPGDIFDYAGKARTAGYTIKQSQLEEKTGLTLIPYEPPQSLGAPFQQPSGTVMNSAKEPIAKPLQNDLEVSRQSSEGGEAKNAQNASDAILDEISKSLASDLKPIAERIAALLSLPEAERAAAAAALRDDLTRLLPDDPQMAAVIEEAMGTSFAAVAAEETK